ncbi:MAG TPA: PEP-CTERM sorting domain-containing protein [Tepidisphaeraceae bacterium]|nr:PEP-CTERM sorting domain-containing protein [Tepidisphaeraceae bacterium]
MVSTFRTLIVGVMVAIPTCALAQQFNGLHTASRVFNNFPSSTLVITNSNTIPGSATISDSLFGPGNGANRDDILLSEDNGTTAATLGIDQAFTISTTFTLTDGANSPRKEAGIRIISPSQGDTQFIVDSDAQEIVAFGGGAPFHEFGVGATGYIPGTPITLSLTYTPASGGTSGANPGSLTYAVDYPTLGLSNSFTDIYTNLEGGPMGYQVGVYAQTDGVAGPSDFLNANFAISASLPEPASLASLGTLSASLLLRRRRESGGN